MIKKLIFSTHSKPIAQSSTMWATLNFCTIIDCIEFKIYARFLSYFKEEVNHYFLKD